MKVFQKYFENFVLNYLPIEYSNIQYINFDAFRLLEYIREEDVFNDYLNHLDKNSYIAVLFRVYKNTDYYYIFYKDLSFDLLTEFKTTKKIPLLKLSVYRDFICDMLILYDNILKNINRISKKTNLLFPPQKFVNDMYLFWEQKHLINIPFEEFGFSIEDFKDCSLDYYKEEHYSII